MWFFLQIFFLQKQFSLIPIRIAKMIFTDGFKFIKNVSYDKTDVSIKMYDVILIITKA